MQEPPAASLARTRAVKRALAQQFEGHPDVVGIGLARHATGFVVKVNLVRPIQQPTPPVIDGVGILWSIVGRIRAHGTEGDG
jgi:hypothetical protein